MFKKINNWQLFLLVAIVSICSLVLIQQYVIAQGGWVDPNTLPGQTPSNVFVVNPLAEDLQLNNHNILGSNLTIDGSATNPNAVSLTGGRKICLAGTCRDTWPVVTGGITGAGTAGKIPIFTAPSVIGDSTIKHLGSNQYSINGDSQSAGIAIDNNGTTYDPLELRLWAFFGSGRNGINISNIGLGGSIKITDTNVDVSALSQNRSSIYIDNASYGNGLYIRQRNTTTTSPGRALRIDDDASGNDQTPVVVDWDGKVGIGTATPNKNLHIDTAGVSNAEIDLQSVVGAGNHWAIYHQKLAGTTYDGLVFWKDGFNRMAFTDTGNILLNGQICDLNGANCFSGAGSNYWTQDVNLNLSRTNSNVYLLANGQALPAAATGASNRFVWYPNKLAIRAGGVNTTNWDEVNIGIGSTAFGYNSMARSNYSTVSGGQGNTISDVSGGGLDATIGGGYNNQIIKSVQGTIAGGGVNRIGTGINSKNAAFIGGGTQNLNNGSSAVIVGGSWNSINDGDDSFIGGGYKNTVAGLWSGIVGGRTNSIAYPTYGSYGFDFIGGGESNTTTAAYAVIGGGYGNSVAGQYSSILGGYGNKADGDYSFAGGKNMQLSATADNTFVWGNSDTPLAITRENAFIIFPNRPTTGSAPRLGFGTASPLTYFHVNSNDAVWVEPFVVSRAGANTFFYLGIERWSANMGIDIGAYSNADGQYKNLTINRGAQGNVGIGITEPTRRLQVEGDIAVRSDRLDGNNYYIQLDKLDSTVPPATDCDEPSEVGRMFWKDVVDRLVVCGTGGWKTFASL